MRFKCTLTKGEKLKRDYNSVIMEGSLKADDPVYIVADIFRNVLGGMLADISTLIEFYNSNHTRNMVSRIYIIGIASKISGICEFVQTTLGIETEKIKSFDRVYFGEKAEKNLKPRQVTLETCLGAVPLGNKRVNLIKSDLQLAKWYQSMDPMVYKVGVLIACLMVLVLCIINFYTYFINNDIAKYERLLAGKGEIIALQNELSEIMAENKKQTAKFAAIPTGIEKNLEKLSAIEEFLAMYPMIDITSYEFKQEQLIISCSAPDETTYFSLQENVESVLGLASGKYEKFSIKFTFEDEED